MNNGHTSIINPGIYKMICNLPEEMKPWLDEAAKTDEETITRWFNMAREPIVYPQGRSLSFRACYNKGEYLVYWVSEGLERRLGIGPGHTVTAVDGTDVHDFVAGLRGKAV